LAFFVEAVPDGKENVRRERVSSSICIFISEEYAEVTAAAIITVEGVVMVDTLPFPHETREILAFLREEQVGDVHYVINTHFHTDHVYGSYLFPQAEVVAHEGCRQALEEYGESSLAEAKRHTPALAEVRLRLPTITFDEEMLLYMGDMTLRLMHLPGHTVDSAGVYVEEERVLLAGDVMMPIPYIAWGDREELLRSLRRVRGLALDSIVQGHGEVLLRGEIKETIDRSITYLEDIYGRVAEKVKAGASERELTKIKLEDYYAEPELILHGLAYELHRANLLKLYTSIRASQS